MINVNDDLVQWVLMGLLSDVSRVKIYRKVKARFEREDISMRAKDCGIDLNKEEVEQAQDFMQRHHDCELSYWDNVDAAINFVKGN